MIYDREFEVYTDMSQCTRFEAPYYERDAKLVIAASTLLASRGVGGYDRQHTEFLEQFGSRTIVMERTADQGPGWWRVTEVI
tara:strand:- start:723 stop:968 length:246 start_codon:yes stop_codon:yes gene_type:complete